MVSTRSHPSAFPPPDLSPTKRASSKDPTPAPTSLWGLTTTNGGAWYHAPRRAILYWLYISLPLVTWDASYVFLRPHSMPGGKFHSPVFSLYKIYCDVDYNYGFPAWDAGTGFTAAQSLLNVAETLLYVAYLAVVLRNGSSDSANAKKVVKGSAAAQAVLLGLTAAVMTLSKTVLYFANEYYSGWENIRHNDWATLTASWIFPNTMWILFPSYMVYSFWGEISRGLEAASGLPLKKTQ
ncbi:hypothetical protein IWZ00DRAFT_17775 [Phyllosticta capitalensis]|uniref:uncharacterized protein n=1 Tax=Phyllosticta capitalensis TaxID=121624 RepID=UPI00312DA53D